jgi:uncharacterized protein
VEASIKFYYTLQDFLPAQRREFRINFSFHGTPSIKDAIESLGVPHTEVDVILVQGKPVDLTYKLHDKNEVEVYPVMPAGTFPINFSLLQGCLTKDKFILDVHLGKLGKALRIMGIDTFMKQDLSEKMIANIAEKENRVVLTRDIGLLKHKKIECGYWLRSQQWPEQFKEVVQRFHLQEKFNPFTRCIVCNGIIVTVDKYSVQQEVPQLSKEMFEEFFQCTQCKKVYWKGSHYDRMEEWVRMWKENP